MFKYYIKKNGFDLGICNGKANAVNVIKAKVQYEGLNALWSNIQGVIKCTAIDPSGFINEYSIEPCHPIQ